MDIIAVCDHNSAENVEAVRRAAEKVELAVIGGMEITSREEVHVLALFRKQKHLIAAQDMVYESLPGENDPDFFGEQLVMDAEDHVVRQNQKLLIGATELTLGEVVDMIHALEGIAIASHVDRPSFSVLSQLGFIPEDLGLDGVEVCFGRIPALSRNLPVISSSDAHRLEQIGMKHTCFLVESGTASEIGLALKQTRGRAILS